MSQHRQMHTPAAAATATGQMIRLGKAAQQMQQNASSQQQMPPCRRAIMVPGASSSASTSKMTTTAFHDSQICLLSQLAAHPQLIS
jgi:hypothetical protein